MVSMSITAIYKALHFKMTGFNGARMALQYICACIMALATIRAEVFRFLSRDE